MPGPLDGLNIPTPKEMGDWLEELFGKGTSNGGPNMNGDDNDKKKGKGEQRKRGGPSVEDLYPKGNKITASSDIGEVIAAQSAIENASKGFYFQSMARTLDPGSQKTARTA